MAKSKSYYHTHPRSSQSASKQSVSQQQEEQEEKKTSTKKLKAAEAVSTVKRNETYQIFIYENGKEKPYTDSKGNNQYRTGTQVSEKMIYNPTRNGWESKAQREKHKKEKGLGKIRRYIVRRVR